MRAAFRRPRGVLWTLPVILLLSIVAMSRLVSAQSTELRLVSTAWPPFTNEAGQTRFALDLVETALSRVGVTTKTTIVPASQFTLSLLSGDYDGSAAAWKDPERESALLFSQPYLENRLVLVGRKGDDVSAATLADLKGKRVAVVEGYSYGDIVDNAGPTFVRSPSEEASLRLLLSKGVDYALMDDIVVQYIVDNYAKEAGANLQLGSKPVLTRQLYFAVRRSRPDAESIINRFNAQLRGMIADHTYHKLLHVSWIRADVDGDGVPEYVPQSDQPGAKAPERAYELFSSSEPKGPQSRVLGTADSRFFIGGSIYTDWATVPDRFKIEDPKRPDPSRSTASIFRFVW